MRKIKFTPIVSSLLLILVFVQCSNVNNTEVPATEPPAEVVLELISPINGAQEQAAEIELTWKYLADAKGYHLLVAEDTSFTEVVADELLESKSYKATLASGKTYFWKTRVINDGKAGEWSNIWSFSTASVEKEPVKISLLAPQNGEQLTASSATFNWESAGEEAKYHFQLAYDQSFTDNVKDSIVQATELSLFELAQGQQYYWRVNPLLSNGTGEWSEVHSFETKQDPPVVVPVPKTGFVTTQNADFVLDGEIYRFAGTNAYHLPNYEKLDPSVVDRAMDSFQDAGITVVRMWGFYDGAPQYSGDITLQPQAGVYSEENLRHLDNVIAKSKEHGVKVVLTLINYWNQLGGISQYNSWAGQSGGMTAFINGEKQQKWFKDYISMLLNRVNTVTGVAYKDEPAIFAWEIMNEGRNRGSNPQVIRDWYQDIAQFIKSIDPNHMVSTGEEGFDESTPSAYSVSQYTNTYILRAQEGTSYILNTQIPEIDYGTAHWYPADWGWFINSWNENPTKTQDLIKAQHAWINDHVRIAEEAGKPFLMGEYGYPGWADERVEKIYDDFWSYSESIKLDGSLIWQFTADYTKCSEFGGNICWPGGRQDASLYQAFKSHIDAMKALK